MEQQDFLQKEPIHTAEEINIQRILAEMLPGKTKIPN